MLIGAPATVRGFLKRGSKLMQYIVYSTNGRRIREPDLDQPFRFHWWHPGLGRVVPPGLTAGFALWWVAHCLRVFRNRNYSVLYIMDGAKIVHRTCLIPAVFRWPFMAKQDLQISSTWTDPEYRGRGLATAALREAILHTRKIGRRFWYVTRSENESSMAVCSKAGFDFVGSSERTRWFGVRLLGQFVLNGAFRDAPSPVRPAVERLARRRVA
jgi:RimJ/RimL family protein N-acetyltransferase